MSAEVHDKENNNATKQWNLYKSCVSWIHFDAFQSEATFSALLFILYITVGSFSSSKILKFHWLTPKYDYA